MKTKEGADKRFVSIKSETFKVLFSKVLNLPSYVQGIVDKPPEVTTASNFPISSKSIISKPSKHFFELLEV